MVTVRGGWVAPITTDDWPKVNDPIWYQWSTNSTTTTGGNWYQPTWQSWNQSYKFTITNNTVIGYDWPAMPVQAIQAPWTWIHADDDQMLVDQWARVNTRYQETEDQRLLREEQAAIRRAQQEQAYQDRLAASRMAAEERAAATVRANELLMALLDAKQKRQVLEHGWFEVISNKGRRWRIRLSDIAGNVDLMPEDENDNTRLASFCAHPPSQEGLPLPDHHLAQKLALETDEEKFATVAYIHHRGPGWHEGMRRPA